jgi:hypothetical protein
MFHDVYNTNTNKSQNIWTSFELLVVQSNSSGSMNDNINMDTEIEESMNDNIHMDT